MKPLFSPLDYFHSRLRNFGYLANVDENKVLSRLKPIQEQVPKHSSLQFQWFPLKQYLCWWSFHPQILWNSLVSIYSWGFLGQKKQPVEVESCNVLHMGRNPTMKVHCFVKQWRKDWLKTQKKTESHSTKCTSFDWVSLRPLSQLDCTLLLFTEEQGSSGGGSWESWLQAPDHRLYSQKPQSKTECAKQLNIYPATWSHSAPFMISMSQHSGLLAQSCQPESNVIKDPPF